MNAAKRHPCASDARLNDPTIIKAELARRELCRRRLLPFVERAIVAQEAPRLMILAPPRHGKTEIVSKAGPAWLLGRHPE